MDRYKEAAEKIKNEKIDRPITDFTSNSEYSAIVYSKGAIMFRVLSELMGKENFLKGLKKYYEDNKFKIAEKRNLINALEATSGIRLDGVFDAWLNGRVKIE